MTGLVKEGVKEGMEEKNDKNKKIDREKYSEKGKKKTQFLYKHHQSKRIV